MSDQGIITLDVSIPGSEFELSEPFVVSCVVNYCPDLFCPLCGEKTIFHYKVNPPLGWSDFVSKEDVMPEATFNCTACGIGFVLPKDLQPFILDKYLAIAIKTHLGIKSPSKDWL